MDRCGGRWTAAERGENEKGEEAIKYDYVVRLCCPSLPFDWEGGSSGEVSCARKAENCGRILPAN